MENKKDFGVYLQTKRIEKGLTQKQLAERLYVTESAVSKWERGVTYPDITLVSNICALLGISEKELLTASEDTQGEKIAKQAKNYSRIVTIYTSIFGIGYALALLTCFIVNIAVSHTLSWFFIVLTSIAVAFSLTLLPLIVKKNKAIITLCSFTASLILLLFVCNIYTGGGSWLIITLLSTILGLSCIFLPFVLKGMVKSAKLQNQKTLIYFIINTILLLVLLYICNVYTGGDWFFSIAVPIAAFSLLLPWGMMLVIRYAKINSFFKTAVCSAMAAIFYGFSNGVYSVLAGDSTHGVSFFNFAENWALMAGGTRSSEFITFLSIFFTLVALCIVFTVVGIYKAKRLKQ